MLNKLESNQYVRGAPLFEWWSYHLKIQSAGDRVRVISTIKGQVRTEHCIERIARKRHLAVAGVEMIRSLKLTDQGLIDVDQLKPVSLFVEG